MLAEVWAFARDYAQYAGRRGFVGGALVLAGAICEGIGLALLVPLVGVILMSGHHTGGGRLQHLTEAAFLVFGAETILSRLAILLTLFVLVMVVRAATLLARDVVLAELRIGFVEALRLRVADHLTRASWDRLAHLQHARISQVISADIQQIGSAALFLTQSASAVMMLAAQCALAVYLAPSLALLSCSLLLVAFLSLRPMMRRAKLLGRHAIGTSLQLMHGTTQFLGGLKLAVSQNLQQGFLDEFEAVQRERCSRQIAFVRQQTESRLVLATLSALVGAVLVVVGVTVLDFPPGILMVLLIIIVRMSGPVGQIQQGVLQLANALPAYAAAQSLIAELSEISAPKSGALAAADFADQTVHFRGVTFLHPDIDGADRRGVADLTLDLEPGSCLGMCGASGSGKTTFADLLAGLYPPQQGRILVGERPMGSVLVPWRSQLAYVAQDPFLFHASVRRNLGWGNPSLGEAEMWQALTMMEADECVWAMANGLDTEVGERGTLVSGGERQRIALARAILRRPRLLILDEATNAVDPAMERRILERLRALKPVATIVMIAHRRESLDLCDRVVTLSAGRLA